MDYTGAVDPLEKSNLSAFIHYRDNKWSRCRVECEDEVWRNLENISKHSGKTQRLERHGAV